MRASLVCPKHVILSVLILILMLSVADACRLAEDLGWTLCLQWSHHAAIFQTMTEQMLWLLALTIKVNLCLSSPSLKLGKLYNNTFCHGILTQEWQAIVTLSLQ